jgi:alpha-tubulin suppressor-like RCC1 family protein
MTRRSILRFAPPLALCAALLSACSDRLPSDAASAPEGPRLTRTPTNSLIQIDAGRDHECGVTSTGQAWCWGRNQYGQLGDSSAASTLIPVAVFQNGVTFASVTAGKEHTCALDNNGAAYCWGANGDGRLGDGTTNLPLAPVAVQGSVVFSRVSAGGAHTCGLDGFGQAYCWGSNQYGQLGDGTTTFRTAPTAVSHPSGVIFFAIAAADKHTCAVASGGQAYCWGYDGDGALGNGAGGGSNVPVAVSHPAGVTFSSIASEYNHACALTSGGSLYCWGDNFYNQLGDNTTTDRDAPVAVQQPAVFFGEVTTGANHSCATAGVGQAYCWGDNAFGQIGDGTTTDRPTPVAVSQPTGVTYSSTQAGGYQTCGLGNSWQAWCSGRNNYSQLGDSTTTNRNAPVAALH